MLSNMKTVGVFVIIFCCFAVLYPKIFHPMVVHIFGLSQNKAKTGGNSAGELPKHPRQMGNGKPIQRPPAHNPHMRTGMHPGMRAAEMRKQAAGEQTGNGKGMINLVLPMYAVGIVIYLVYTMAKVFMRNNNKSNDQSGPGPFESKSEYRARSQYREDTAPYYNYNASDMDDETKFLLSKREKLEELEQLLAKAELKQINQDEMVQLRQKLEETESQMSRILEAMQHVQTRVKHGIDAHLADNDATERNGEGETITVTKTSLDSSPDMDSYEMLSKPSSKATTPGATTPSDAQPKGPPEDGLRNRKAGKSNAKKAQVSAVETDLNALDSESSGRRSDDEDSEDEEDEIEEADDGDSEDLEEDLDDMDEDERGIYEINGTKRIPDYGPGPRKDIFDDMVESFDKIPRHIHDDDDDDGGSHDWVRRGDVINDVMTDSDDDDGVENLGYGGDYEDDYDTGSIGMEASSNLRQRKTQVGS